MTTAYTIRKKFTTRVQRTPRVLECAEAFGIGLADKDFTVYDGLEIPIDQGDVVYITGQSGSGKSLMLKELVKLMREYGVEVANLDEIAFDERPLVDQVGKDFSSAARLLSMAGLNDATLFVRSPSQLSDGQKYRFKLAKVIESSAKVWVADEFTATLDRFTARMVAFCLQKMAREVGATVLVATTHMDLEQDLNPSLVIKKFYQDKVEVIDLKKLRGAA